MNSPPGSYNKLSELEENWLYLAALLSLDTYTGKSNNRELMRAILERKEEVIYSHNILR